MSHVSVKVALHKLPTKSADSLLRRAKDGAGRAFVQDHADDIYALPSGGVLKIRTYADARQEIILEKTRGGEDLRHSNIAVAYVRPSNRDSDARDILGAPNLHVSKKRRSYVVSKESGIRLYHDQFEDGRSFLEWQMDDRGRPSVDVASDLKQYILAQGFNESDLIYDSYSDLLLSPLFNQKSGYTSAYANIPQSLKDKILKEPVFKMDAGQKIFSKGDRGDFALLIRGGNVHVPEDDVTLGAGQLVGEFASLEQGVRVCDVVCKTGLEGYVVRGNLLEELMLVVPANAQKYLTWRRAQAQRPISGP